MRVVVSGTVRCGTVYGTVRGGTSIRWYGVRDLCKRRCGTVRYGAGRLLTEKVTPPDYCNESVESLANHDRSLVEWLAIREQNVRFEGLRP